MRLPTAVGSAPGYTQSTKQSGIFYLTVPATLAQARSFFTQAYPANKPWVSPTFNTTDKHGFRFTARHPHDVHGYLGVVFTATPTKNPQRIELQCQWAYLNWH